MYAPQSTGVRPMTSVSNVLARTFDSTHAEVFWQSPGGRVYAFAQLVLVHHKLLVWTMVACYVQGKNLGPILKVDGSGLEKALQLPQALSAADLSRFTRSFFSALLLHKKSCGHRPDGTPVSKLVHYTLGAPLYYTPL